MRDDRERLKDILEAIERIEKHTSAGRSALDQEELVQTWVVHHYFGIDLEIVWGVVEQDLPAFRKLIREILLSEP